MTLLCRSLLPLLLIADPSLAADASGSPKAAPVAALAYHPAGQFLAVGEYGRVLFVDPSNGDLLHTQPVMAGPVSAVAVVTGRLAVVGGTPGKPPDLRVYAL